MRGQEFWNRLIGIWFDRIRPNNFLPKLNSWLIFFHKPQVWDQKYPWMRRRTKSKEQRPAFDENKLLTICLTVVFYKKFRWRKFPAISNWELKGYSDRLSQTCSSINCRVHPYLTRNRTKERERCDQFSFFFLEHQNFTLNINEEVANSHDFGVVSKKRSKEFLPKTQNRQIARTSPSLLG